MKSIQYICNELIVVAPLPLDDDTNGQFRIQITSGRGKTKFLNIDPKTFKKIELALLEMAAGE